MCQWSKYVFLCQINGWRGLQWSDHWTGHAGMYVLQFNHLCCEMKNHPNDYINHYPSDPFRRLGKIIHEFLNEGFGAHTPSRADGVWMQLFSSVLSALFFQGLPEWNHAWLMPDPRWLMSFCSKVNDTFNCFFSLCLWVIVQIVWDLEFLL